MRTKHFPMRTPGTDLRVATFNIWGWFGDWPERQLKLKELWDESPHDAPPDVLLLQEGCYSLRSDQTREVVEMLGYPYWLHALGIAPDPQGEGVAVASRLPFKQARTFPLPMSEPGRTIASVWLEVKPNLEVCCVSAHAAYAPERVRDEQIKAICHLSGQRMIIGGDLNANPEIVGTYLNDANLVDSLADNEVTTWPIERNFFAKGWSAQTGHEPDFSLKPRRLDYLLSRGCNILASGAVSGGDEAEGYPSDHALVWTDYSFNL